MGKEKSDAQWDGGGAEAEAAVVVVEEPIRVVPELERTATPIAADPAQRYVSSVVHPTRGSSFSGLLLVSFLHVAVAGSMAVVFLLYPSLLQTASQILDCVRMEVAPEQFAYVIRNDASVTCAGPRYDVAENSSRITLYLIGFGAPLLCASLFLLFTFTSCRGELLIAQSLFSVFAGGYRTRFCWFWEVLHGYWIKLFLIVWTEVLATQVDRRSLLGGLWICLAAFSVTSLVRPFLNDNDDDRNDDGRRGRWRRQSLSTVVLLSLAALSVMFGLAVLSAQELSTVSSLDTTSLSDALGILLASLHLAVCTCFVIAELWFVWTHCFDTEEFISLLNPELVAWVQRLRASIGERLHAVLEALNEANPRYHSTLLLDLYLQDWRTPCSTLPPPTSSSPAQTPPPQQPLMYPQPSRTPPQHTPFAQLHDRVLSGYALRPQLQVTTTAGPMINVGSAVILPRSVTDLNRGLAVRQDDDDDDDEEGLFTFLWCI